MLNFRQIQYEIVLYEKKSIILTSFHKVGKTILVKSYLGVECLQQPCVFPQTFVLSKLINQ